MASHRMFVLLHVLLLYPHVHPAGIVLDPAVDTHPALGDLCGWWRRCAPVVQFCDAATDMCTHCYTRCDLIYPDDYCSGVCPYYLQSLTQAPPEVKDVLNTTSRPTPQLNITQGHPHEAPVQQSGSSHSNYGWIGFGMVIFIVMVLLAIGVIRHYHPWYKTKRTATTESGESREGIPMMERQRSHGDDVAAYTGAVAGAVPSAVVADNTGADPVAQDSIATTQDGEVDPLVSAQPEVAAVQNEDTTTQDDEILRAQAHADDHSRQQQTRPGAEADSEQIGEEQIRSSPQQLHASLRQSDVRQPQSPPPQLYLSLPPPQQSRCSNTPRPKKCVSFDLNNTQYNGPGNKRNIRLRSPPRSGNQAAPSGNQLSVRSPYGMASSTDHFPNQPDVRPKQPMTRTTRPTSLTLTASNPHPQTSVDDDPGHRDTDASSNLCQQCRSSTSRVSSSTPGPLSTSEERAHEPGLSTDRAASISPPRPSSSAQCRRQGSRRGLQDLHPLPPRGAYAWSPPRQASPQERPRAPQTSPPVMTSPDVEEDQHMTVINNIHAVPRTVLLAYSQLQGVTDPRYPYSNRAAGPSATTGYVSVSEDLSLVTIDGTQQDEEADGIMYPEQGRNNGNKINDLMNILKVHRPR